jgi:hypothetical protein
MSAFDMASFGEAAAVTVDVYTSAYRISGMVHTRFARVADILNLNTAAHLAVEHATISEHGDEGGPIAAPTALVLVDEILVMIAPELAGEARSDMLIQKRAVRAQLAIPPLRVTGAIHVPMGGRPVDGLLNVPERFLPMTDVTITCAAHSDLERSAAAVALRRDRAHILLVADDENPDELLADVLDERTAESWLRGGEPTG